MRPKGQGMLRQFMVEEVIRKVPRIKAQAWHMTGRGGEQCVPLRRSGIHDART